MFDLSVTMKSLRCRLSVPLACLAAMLCGAGLEAAPLRILPVGDSITAGYLDSPTWNLPNGFGYRSSLYQLLTQAGYDIQFVGASPEPFNNASGDPTHGGTVGVSGLDLRTVGQNGHRGYGGQDINYFSSNIAGYLATDQPDVILLMIGINGINSGSPAQLNTLVGRIFENRPQVQLIVAQITPLISYNADLYNYNTYIRQTLVPAYAAQGRKIYTVDQYANFLTNPANPGSIDAAKFSNGINHPSQAAYGLMAQTWFAGIQALPRAVALDNLRFSPALAGGQAVGALGVPLAPAAEAYTYSLAAGTGGDDNGKFAIAADGKLVAGNYDFSQDPPTATYQVRVQAQSALGGEPLTGTFKLSLAVPAAIATFHSTDQQAYAADVSATDLLQGLAGAYTGFNTGMPGARINDGAHGGPTDLNGIAWATRGNTASATYTLGAGPNGAGYDVTSITSIAAWNSAGFMNQKYQVSVRYSGDTAFTVVPELLVDYQPVTNINGEPNGEAGATKVVITAPAGGGPLLRGIEQIRFSILDTFANPAGGVTLREIDVQGAPALAVVNPRMLELKPPGPGVSDGARIVWRSRAGVSYQIESSADLSTWGVREAAWPSGGMKTSYTDLLPAVAGEERRFYRVTER